MRAEKILKTGYRVRENETLSLKSGLTDFIGREASGNEKIPQIFRDYQKF